MNVQSQKLCIKINELLVIVHARCGDIRLLDLSAKIRLVKNNHDQGAVNMIATMIAKFGQVNVEPIKAQCIDRLDCSLIRDIDIITAIRDNYSKFNVLEQKDIWVRVNEIIILAIEVLL